MFVYANGRTEGYLKPASDDVGRALAFHSAIIIPHHDLHFIVRLSLRYQSTKSAPQGIDHCHVACKIDCIGYIRRSYPVDLDDTIYSARLLVMLCETSGSHSTQASVCHRQRLTLSKP